MATHFPISDTPARELQGAYAYINKQSQIGYNQVQKDVVKAVQGELPLPHDNPVSIVKGCFNRMLNCLNHDTPCSRYSNSEANFRSKLRGVYFVSDDLNAYRALVDEKPIPEGEEVNVHLLFQINPFTNLQELAIENGNYAVVEYLDRLQTAANRSMGIEEGGG